MADNSKLPRPVNARKQTPTPSSSSRTTLYQPPHKQNLRIYSNSSSNSHNKSNNTRNTNINQHQVSKISSSADHVDDEIDVPHIVGACPFMCPVQERLQRERLRDLHVFERLNGNPGKSSPSLAVKKFCRTISSNQVTNSDVRPVSVLLETLDYLFSLWSSREQPFEVVHDFLFDRTRSVRQDLSMQNIISNDCISMYERMVR